MTDDSPKVSFFERWRTAIVVSTVVVLSSFAQIIFFDEAMRTKMGPSADLRTGNAPSPGMGAGPPEAFSGGDLQTPPANEVSLGEGPLKPNPAVFNEELDLAIREAARQGKLDPSSLPPSDALYLGLIDSGHGPELTALGKEFVRAPGEGEDAYVRRVTTAYVKHIAKGEVPSPAWPGGGLPAGASDARAISPSPSAVEADIGALDERLATKVREAASSSGRDPESFLPSPEVRSAAIQSRSLESEATSRLLSDYQRSFETLGLTVSNAPTPARP